MATDEQALERLLYHAEVWPRDVPVPADDRASFGRGQHPRCSVCCEDLAETAPGSVEFKYPSLIETAAGDHWCRIRFCRRCFALWDRWRRDSRRVEEGR